MNDVPLHVPVMPAECLEHLAPPPGGTVLDATLGLGGHAELLLRAVGAAGRLIAVDQDPEALRLAEGRLRAACREWGWDDCPVTFVRANFREFLFDLGVSSMQLDRPERGFSFRAEGPLDMRMDSEAPESAADLANTLPEAELARLLWEFGDERHSRRIARRIVERRPLRTTLDLEQAVWSAYPAAERNGRIHPATRTFQALRIAVNGELAALEPALLGAADRLKPGGRLVVLAYHSLEDRIVKRTFEFLAGRCRCPAEAPVCGCGAVPRARILTRKPLEPGEAEVAANPRARSARLRALAMEPGKGREERRDRG
jgi:16S rRNA (cytosine1402-N4)-methyltransferase